jgi:hypothetical protein
VRRTYAFALIALAATNASATTFYVRQRAGDDAKDGLSPATAWQHVGKLTTAMRAGDTAYVGPGLYREEIEVRDSGTADRPIVFVADDTGQHTGDPAGTVMLSGAEPVDETIFQPTGAPGVYSVPFPSWTVWGVVEMDGPQPRYVRVTITHEYLVEKLTPVDVVGKLRSSFFHDEATRTLYLHTSDDRPPTAHELELIQRGHGIYARGKEHVTVVGFTFRHMQDSGVSFFQGAAHGTAIGTVSYGNRQGIRVYGSTDVLIYGCTLFRNENAGAYFAAGSSGGRALRVTSFENVKGLRWSSNSTNAVVADAVLFDNSERGLSLENADGAIIRGTRFANNTVSQLQVIQSRYSSDENCFTTNAGQLVADFTPFGFEDHYATLDEYRGHQHQDEHSRTGTCGPLPEKPHVHALHAATMGVVPRQSSGGIGGWLRGLLGGGR